MSVDTPETGARRRQAGQTASIALPQGRATLDGAVSPLTQRRRIAGVDVIDAKGGDVVQRLRSALAGTKLTRVAFLNAHCANIARRDRAYREAMAQCLVLPDGVGVDIGAKILYGAPFSENLNGTDFLPRFLMALRTGRRVALVGGRPGIADRAVLSLAAIAPQHHYEAVSDGFFGEAGLPDVLSRLEEGRFDIVLVAMGVPLQERFIVEALDHRHGQVAFAVGALFDFLAGEVVRAPRAVRRLRLEWVWRLGLEPGRLWRRYILGNPLFIAGMLKDRLMRIFQAGPAAPRNERG
ncbi:MAG: WecB/TagA/CpsF family glycosyltransferase [Fulvimarina manganoxydans]|uniref:WecB/TagA/CpsF family glycosyltransferase n=1 Tax=Fulvimarina manganoxydans TaxID=937218 RepID=UPI0023529167|nr:WecB/TagA/CpsF family glycosyltransferase [Fulvimarina manganoxydans]MCK5933008.1 WecB/TagA/CpsF family glycosyltransferase [Fulvimarina manganoxydans]